MWIVIGGVPAFVLLSTAFAYGMGAFKRAPPPPPYRPQSFQGDEEFATGNYESEGGRRKKTRKSKSHHKKTKRRT